MKGTSVCWFACWLLSSTFTDSAYAILASDDAAQSAYDDGWQVGDNGGTGFAPWSVVGHANPGTGAGGTFIPSSNSHVSIGTGPNNAAFGIFGSGGGVGHAVRPFGFSPQVGDTFSMDMDNKSIDTGGTVGFGLRNAAGDNLVEFFFVGGQTNYTLSADGVSGTTPGFTAAGLNLSLSLTGGDAFTFTIDEQGNGPGIDHTLTGNLFDNADQQITNLRLFNANAGHENDVFFNNIAITAIPEASPLIALPAVAVVGLLVLGVRRRFGRRISTV